ncbi:MAG: DUF6498-containing protein [Candidatus Altiarchaeota archaeon]
MPEAAAKSAWSDPSAVSLAASNLFVILLAVLEGWNLMTVLWVYWCQSLIIGLFSLLRMLSLGDYSTEGVEINGLPLTPSSAVKAWVTVIFIIGFGFFHAAYAVFLLFALSDMGYRILSGEIPWMLLAVAIFLVNHGFSYIHNVREDSSKRLNIGVVAAIPFARILPMHLTIIASGFIYVGGIFLSMGLYLVGLGSTADYLSMAGPTLLLILFQLLKSAADVRMHQIEHASPQEIARWVSGQESVVL